MRLPSLGGASFVRTAFVCALWQGLPSRHEQGAEGSTRNDRLKMEPSESHGSHPR